MTAPLEGIRVVEIASFVAVPAAGALLADLGAEVIKVEVPRGEVFRYALPRFSGFAPDFPEAPAFQMDNRGKRSIALDVTRPAALRALERVIEGADVVLTNMLPGRLAKYGLDAETLRARRPELIFACLSGYGHEGPEADTPAFDYTAYWARTGFMDQMRDEGASPTFLRPGTGDHAAAMGLTAGILAALRVRDQTGEGQVVSTSLMHVGFYIQGNDAAMALVANEAPRHDRRATRNPLWNHYRTSDGRWLFLVMIESDRYWPGLCRAIGREDLIDETRYTGVVERYRHSEELIGLLDAVFAERPLAEWEKRLDEHTLIWSPVRTLPEAVQDATARATGVFQTVEHPTAGPFETIAPPVRLSGHEMRGERPAPALGADGADVLAEAGCSEQEIGEALRVEAEEVAR